MSYLLLTLDSYFNCLLVHWDWVIVIWYLSTFRHAYLWHLLACVRIWRPEADTKCPSPLLFAFYIEVRTLIWTRIFSIQLVWLAADPEAPLSLSSSLLVGYYKSYQAPAWLLKIWPPASAFPTNPSLQPSVCLSLIRPQVAANLPLSTAFVVSNKFWHSGSPFWFISRNDCTSFFISFLLLGCSKLAYFSAVEMAQKFRALTSPPVVLSSILCTHMVGNYHL